jgi:hypothetical protein
MTLRLLRGEDSVERSVTVPSHLVLRGSTAPPAAPSSRPRKVSGAAARTGRPASPSA